MGKAAGVEYKPIRVLHVSGSISRHGAGVSVVIGELCRYGRREGLESIVMALKDSPDVADYPLPSDLDYQVFPASGPAALRVSGALSRGLESLGDIQVVHSHGLWLPTGWQARHYAAKRGLPLVISPHGMLEPWALTRSRWKKKLAGWLFENRNLSAAACLHAASEQEAQAFRTAGYGGPVAVIPFGVSLDGRREGKSAGLFRRQFPELAGKRIVLFLSRLHPKKGLDDLLGAWTAVHPRHPEWHLVVAGPDEGGYRGTVEALVDRYGIGNSVSLVGPLFEDMKHSGYAAADLFVLPSHSENFGVVIVEALASGCPVITTVGTPWRELKERNCGWWIAIGEDPLRDTLEEAMSLCIFERKAMGVRGRELVKSHYSWETSAQSFGRLYRWLAAGGPDPEFLA